MRWISRFAILFVVLLASCARSAHAEPLTIAHPDRSEAKIEYFVEHPSGSGPWPMVVLLHGHQVPTERIGGLAFKKWGVLTQLAKKGYLAVSISLPGYGGSTGPEDFAGAFTQHAVEAVIGKLEADRQVIPRKVVIEGISLGAVTGALVATHENQLAGLVLISGVYDLQPFFANPKSAGALAVKTAFYEQTGGGAEALQSRSVLPVASRIHASTLILNGAKDDRTDPDQAQRLGAAIQANHVQATVHIFPEYGHAIPIGAREAEVNSFIDATLRR